MAAARQSEGVTRVGPPERGDPGARFDVILAGDPFGTSGFASIEPLRTSCGPRPGTPCSSAGRRRRRPTCVPRCERDTKVLIPLVLAVVLVILVLLRAPSPHR